MSVATAKKNGEGHRARLRARILNDPYNTCSYELLELLLGYVHLRSDTKILAKVLLEKYGSIRGLLASHPAERHDIPGCGPATETFLTLLREIIARYFMETVKCKKSVTIGDIAQLGMARLAELPHEEVWVALLDNGNRLLTFERVNKGTVGQVLLSTRDAVEITLKYKATGLIVLHNHPGGALRPSTLDTENTFVLCQALETIGLRLIDHLILADGKCYSMMQEKLLG